ncbi:GYF domain-containing protein [uncultured Paludibaculum sp.]|uniref:GYF domain-containing protein n=1 Tax=uncultured Paludibaculum sp. TaxID=1765020 RepID=UPI002AAAFBC8|nr:GYF domain-containing protein [uncultured Paludibaculum sp.]
MNRYCGTCGTLADAEDRFCPGCGKPIGGAPAPAFAAQPNPVPAYPAQPRPPQAPVYGAQQAPSPAFQAPQRTPPPPPFLMPVAPPPPPPPAPAAQRPDAQWFYAVGGKQQGPVPESVLRVALQTLPADTLVWQPGLPSWKPATEVGLKAPASSAYSAPPPQFQPMPAAPAAFNAPAPGFNQAPPPARPAFGPPPGFPAPAAPQFGAPAVASAAPVNGPTPPSMHWLVLLIFTWVTAGLAGLVWTFRQAAFVKKIDPSSKAVMLLVITTLGMVAQVVMYIAAMRSLSSSSIATASGVILLLNVVIIICGLMAVFGMRSSIVRYYNTTEPIGLRLSGVMTFFFSILYFQYHFSRIVEWRKTGRLG